MAISTFLKFSVKRQKEPCFLKVILREYRNVAGKM